MHRKLICAIGAVALFAVLFTASESAAWQMPEGPKRGSQMAMVGQRINTTDFTVVYHRPSVTPPAEHRRTKDFIWGGVVPYGQAWRAGANNATTFSFSKDVIVEGKELAAGTYGIWMIPEENEVTVIFNKNNDVWGARYPGAEGDVLRVKVKRTTGHHMEYLMYYWDDIKPDSGVLTLHWEKVKIPIAFKVK